ncbi:MAG: Asp-tRNA(Asn)/Glu-tRNA(Gln) amidotransferase subunit GatB [Bacteroidetes bacterium]|nr:Asp-tRNA(Asn)/Glu-tRNA(Gln) amidotransferase subunit GatB [Bacteroidota bacterium]
MIDRVAEKYEIVVGLEVHAQLRTRSKIFNSDPASYGGTPNSQVGVITLAHPGTLPKQNKLVVEYAVKMGLACHAAISRHQIFDRKNYFYPDLPKGYQITQDRTPICRGGYISIKTKEGKEKNILLNRIHLEEDAGKSIHPENEEVTLLDFNRAGVPLIEVVTEPEIHTSEEAALVLMEIRKLVRYLEICDGNMEEGSLRCDANISVRQKGHSALGKKVEIKNMNSFKNVQRAIDYEATRQIALLEKEEPVISETRTFNMHDGKTYAMRTKEELNDYRYFPDPDLSPVEISDEWLHHIQSLMPALPNDLKEKFIHRYQLSEYEAQVLTEEKEVALYFEKLCAANGLFKENANWMMGPVKAVLNQQKWSMPDFQLAPATLAELIRGIADKKIGYTTAVQQLFPHLLKFPQADVMQTAKELNLLLVNDAGELDELIAEIVKEFPLKVEEYQKGKKGIVTMFMGELKKRSHRQVDYKLASEKLIKKLSQTGVR